MADVTIKVRLDGPYKVSGPAIVRAADGTAVGGGDPEQVAILCRCGRSATPPTCDLSHRHPDDDHPTR